MNQLNPYCCSSNSAREIDHPRTWGTFAVSRAALAGFLAQKTREFACDCAARHAGGGRGITRIREDPSAVRDYFLKKGGEDATVTAIRVADLILR